MSSIFESNHVKQHKSGNCAFILAWIGKCGKSDCKEHIDIKCVCCGAQATGECAETFGFVCGAPLCDGCVHELTPEGVNRSGIYHVRKKEQKFAPWYIMGSK